MTGEKVPGLMRARLILEYDDGTVHSFDAEEPADVVMKLDYAPAAGLIGPEVSVSGPAYIAPYAAGVGTIMGATLSIKAGFASMRYRNG